MRGNLCSRGKGKLSSYDDGVAWLHSLLDHHQIAILPLARLDRPLFDGAVGFNHENKWTALTNLHRLRGHQFGILQNVENKAHAHKFPRPKQTVRIRRYATRFHGSGARLHDVIDKI